MRAAGFVAAVCLMGLCLTVAVNAVVAPGAQVFIHFTEFDHESRADGLGPRTLRVHLVPTGDAPAGPVNVTVRLDIQDFERSDPATRLERDATINVPPAESPERNNGTQVAFDWKPASGLYWIETEVYNDVGVKWDSRTDTHQVGFSDRLSDGWGRIQHPSTSAMDLDGDESPDLILRTADDEPVEWNITASTTTAFINADIQRNLEIQFYYYPEGRTETNAYLPRENVTRVVSPGQERRIDVKPNPPARIDEAYPELTIHLPATTPGACCMYQLLISSYEPTGRLNTWYDGYQNRVNLTAWDPDQDGDADIRFWDSDATISSEANATEEADRRERPVQLEVQVTVDEVKEGTEIDFELERADENTSGAWIEISDMDQLFHDLLRGDETTAPAKAKVVLLVAGDEGSVQQSGGITWAWVQHFSAKNLRVFVPAAVSSQERDGVEDPDPHHSDVPAPETLTGLLAMVAVVAGRRRRRG